MDNPMEMQHQAMGYDRTATMFSPEGYLLQVEYAEKSVKLGSGSIGMACKDGIVIIADKRIKDKLIVPESSNKIYEIDDHMISSVAGIVSDARVLIEKGQVLAQQHRVTYDSPIEPQSIIKEISNIKQQFTQYGGARPFGVAILLGGINHQSGKPEVYTSDITGNYFSYYAIAIGENDEKIKEKLREKYSKDFDINEGIKTSLDIFKEIKGEKFDINDFELAYIPLEDKKIKRAHGKEINSIINKK